MKLLILSICLLSLVACSSVTVRTDSKVKDTTPPTFEKRYPYWFFGLKGFHSVNVREVCKNREVKQMQSVDTLGDVFLSIVTIGIYTPRSARVWCAEDIES